MVIQRRPTNAMAPDPVAIANAMAAQQPQDIAVRVPQLPPRLVPYDSEKSKKEGTSPTKKYPKEKALKEFGITSEDYHKWYTERDLGSNALSLQERQARVGVPDKEAQAIIGPGAGLLFNDNAATIDPMAIDRDYRRLRDAGFSHQSALNQIYHAYGYSGYAYSNLSPKGYAKQDPRDFYPQTKWDLRNYIRPYDPDLIG